MKAGPELKPASEYAEVLRPLLASHMFGPDRRGLLRAGLNLAIVACGYSVLSQSASIWLRLPTSLLIGHSLACLAFVAHDVSHNSVVRSRFVRGFLELLLWGLNLIPPTLWHRVHNQTHHSQTNTVSDPDRPFRKSELTPVTRVYIRIFYPNRRTPARHPLFLSHFVAYILRNIVAALLPNGSKPSVVPSKPSFTARQRTVIVCELGILGLLQYAIWVSMGRNTELYLGIRGT